MCSHWYYQFNNPRAVRWHTSAAIEQPQRDCILPMRKYLRRQAAVMHGAAMGTGGHSSAHGLVHIPGKGWQGVSSRRLWGAAEPAAALRGENVEGLSTKSCHGKRMALDGWHANCQSCNEAEATPRNIMLPCRWQSAASWRKAPSLHSARTNLQGYMRDVCRWRNKPCAGRGSAHM